MSKKILSLTLILSLLAVLINLPVKTAQAAAITSASDTMSTVKASTLANHEFKFGLPTGIAAAGTVAYTFPTGFNMGTVAFGDIDFATGSTSTCSSATYTEQTLAATASGTTWGAAVAGLVLTITSGTGTSTAGNCVRLRVGTNAAGGVNQITNPGVGSYGITIGPTDTGTITVNIIANDVVAVSGTVNQSLSFSISATTIAFGTLDSAAARFANTTTGSATDVVAHTLPVSTNSANGYTITVKGATLTSSSFTITAIGATPATSAAGTEQFGIYATKAGGVNGTIAAPYATVSSFGYDATGTTATTFASGTSATATETYSLHYLANISGTTEPGTYTANLTYVATGNF